MKNIKSKNYLITIIASASLLMQSCVGEDNSSFKCTIYLNGRVWSEKTVSDCSLCIAPPQGYTKTCIVNWEYETKFKGKNF